MHMHVEDDLPACLFVELLDGQPVCIEGSLGRACNF